MTESSGKQVAENKPLAASGAEVIFLLLLVVFGMGLCVWVERGFTLAWEEPTEQRAFDTSAIRAEQEKLTRLETAIKESENELDAIALNQLKHTATLKSLESLHPELVSPRQTGTTPVLAEAERSYTAAKTQQMADEELASLLAQRITSLKTEVDKATSQLKSQKQMATDKLRGERRKYLAAKYAAAFLLPLFFVVVAFFIGAARLNRVAGKRVWTSHGARPLLLVAGALGLLLVYQAFEIAGAVLIGLILFLVVLRKLNWSPKADA